MWDVWEGAGACLPSSRAGLSPGSIISARACGAGGRIPLSSPGTGKSYSSISPFVPGFLSPAHNPCCPGSGGGSRLAELEQAVPTPLSPAPSHANPPFLQEERQQSHDQSVLEGLLICPSCCALSHLHCQVPECCLGVYGGGGEWYRDPAQGLAGIGFSACSG